jgi:ElaB/YqjD/DUF883 family membrane-anchored ribosome-binding protein
MDTGTSSDRLHSTVDKAAQSAHQAVDRMAAKAGPAVERVREKAMQATDTLHAKMDDLSVMQEQWMGTMRDQVRAHPLAVVGAAVLAGLLIGRLMR